MFYLELSKSVKAAISQAALAATARAVSQELKIKSNRLVSVAIVADQEIRRLNRLYRGRDQATDVLSFKISGQDTVAPAGGYFGEIVISYPQTVKQARTKGWSVKQEFDLLLIHGLLHLSGYDHETNASGAKHMLSLQAKIHQHLEKKPKSVIIQKYCK